MGFTGVVDHADALGIGHDLLDQVHLLVQSQQIGHAGDVVLGSFPARHQLGGDGVTAENTTGTVLVEAITA